jgi:hypothetical protein
MIDRRPGDPRGAALLAEYAECFGHVPIPVPVDAIAVDLLGLRTRLVEGLPCSGALYPAERLILLSAEEARESEGRRRFTLAHEVAHWVLHQRGRPEADSRPHVLARGDAPGDVDTREREANVFGAELLMPRDEVRRTAADGLGVPEAALVFLVSEPAMAWRYFNLGLAAAPPTGSAPPARPIGGRSRSESERNG